MNNLGEFIYTKDNWVKGITDREESSITEIFTLFNQFGDPLTSEQYGEDYGREKDNGGVCGKFEYKYISRDSKGNWTLREIIYTDTYDNKTTTKRQQRKIEYY